MANHEKKLVEQSDALSDFFESLMRDVDAYQEQEEIENSQQHAADTNTTVTAKIVTEAGSEPGSEPEPDPDLTQPASSQPGLPETQTITAEPDNKLFETLPPVMPEPVIIEQTEPLENDLEITDAEQIAIETTTEAEQDTNTEADWRQHDFQAMLFKVAGLTLAVPLVDLNGVVECNLDDVAAMPGHADFYLGLMKHLDKNVPLVDTARFVLPADKLSTLTGDDPYARITRAVMIQDCQYGLACDEVNEVVTLSPDAVRWRTQRTQRRWLAGTVVEHMCALIDATAFAELLAERTPIQAFRE